MAELSYSLNLDTAAAEAAIALLNEKVAALRSEMETIGETGVDLRFKCLRFAIETLGTNLPAEDITRFADVVLKYVSAA